MNFTATKVIKIASIILLVIALGVAIRKHGPSPEVASETQTKAAFISPERELAIITQTLNRIGTNRATVAPDRSSNHVHAADSKELPIQLEDQNKTTAVDHPNKSAIQSYGKTPKNLEDPIARIALAYVGNDWDAEAYWAEAIFDPSLPDKEREDLMEDLNEEGFLDPHHPSPDELPLILARLQLIEEIAPTADEFMRPHLAEAYKDLVNMLDGRGPQ
jgi:hypothetical protein